MGRASIPAGPPTSNETATRSVGPITRMARDPTDVINHNKNLCHQLYGRPRVDASFATGAVVAELISVLYRPKHRVERTLLSAAVDSQVVWQRTTYRASPKQSRNRLQPIRPALKTYLPNTPSHSPAIGCNLILQS